MTAPTAIQQQLDDYTASNPGVSVVVGYASMDDGYGSGVLTSPSAPIGFQDGNSYVVQSSTPFEIGSVSKIFAMDMLNQNQGYVNTGVWPGDVTLGDLLPNLSAQLGAQAQIPVANIATYTSGLPYDTGDDCGGESQFYGFPFPLLDTAYWSTLIPVYANSIPFSPGKYYTYSDLSWSLLGMAAVGYDELGTDNYGAQFDAGLASYIQGVNNYLESGGYSPLTNTVSYYNPSFKPTTLPNGWWRNDPNSDDSLTMQLGPPVLIPEIASGGIVSSGDDMLSYLQYWITSGSTAAMSQQADAPDYCTGDAVSTGYGWFQDDVDQIIWKNGLVLGFSSFVMMSMPAAGAEYPASALFALTNGPDAVNLGWNAYQAFIGGDGSQDFSARTYSSVKQPRNWRR